MTIPQDVKQSPIAAKKAERDSDKAEAMREYRAERLASQANVARLRALRLAKENTEFPATNGTASGEAKSSQSANLMRKRA